MATTVTLTGTYKNGPATAAAGSLTFRLTHPLSDAAGVIIATQAPIVATLTAGAFSVQLYATNDPTTSPTSVLYEVTEKITGARPRSFLIQLDYHATTVDLSTIAPVSDQPAAYSYATAAAFAIETAARVASVPPASLLIIGDSYCDPAGVNVAANDGQGKRIQDLLSLDAGHVLNVAVSGGAAANHFTNCSYAQAWAASGVTRTVGPYAPDIALEYIKLSTNDAIRSTSVTQQAGYVSALRSIIYHGQAGSVFGHHDASVTVDGGWSDLLWANLAAEPYDVTPQTPVHPWGRGTGCWRSGTVGSVLTIAVPADHTGTVDLFFIGSWYGGSADIKVDGVLNQSITTGGLGIPNYGGVLYDERRGTVARVTGLAAGARTVTVTVTAVDAGSTNNPGRVRFGHWSIAAPAEDRPLVLLADCPRIPVPGSYWVGVTSTVADTYTTWIDALAVEVNGGAGTWPVQVVPVNQLLTTADTLNSSGAADPAGHPNSVGSAKFAAAVLKAYNAASHAPQCVAWNASWVTASYLPATTTLDAIPAAVGDVLPATDLARSFGNFFKRWKDGFISRLLAGAGSAAAPSVTSYGDNTSGLHFGGAQVNTDVSGVKVVAVTPAQVAVTGNIIPEADGTRSLGLLATRFLAAYAVVFRSGAGTAAAPSYTSGGYTADGLYFGGNQVNTSVQGTRVLGVTLGQLAVTGALAVSGITGAVGASRYVGASTGAPTTGTFAVGDFTIDSSAVPKLWVCTVAGTPGTWAATMLTVGTTAGTVAAGDDSRITGAAAKASNLSDLANAATARTNLGLGTAATTAASAYVPAASTPAPPVDVQTFTATGTWTKPTAPAGCAPYAIVEAFLLGAGAGSGSGRRGAAGSVRCGGGAGGTGGFIRHVMTAAQLGATETVTVGAGGGGGAAVTVDDTNGNPGGTGGYSQFSSGANIIRTAAAAGGLGGTNALGTGGAGGYGDSPGALGGSAGITGGPGGPGAGTAGAITCRTTAGGAGGGITSGDVPNAGGAGGAQSQKNLAGGTAGTVPGGAGGAGTAPTLGTGEVQGGSGGGGGAASITGAAGAGGAAGGYGSSGGGGGASLNGNNSGKGGDGGSGLVQVITR